MQINKYMSKFFLKIINVNDIIKMYKLWNIKMYNSK